MLRPLLWVAWCAAAVAARVRVSSRVVGLGGSPLINANVTANAAADCTPRSVLTPASGEFTLSCAGTVSVSVWARQYTPVASVVVSPGVNLALKPRPMEGFPASNWQFEGWAAEAVTGNVPGSNISFLAHPSAYRTPSGRVFMISTANSVGSNDQIWTQGYWQEENSTAAVPLPYQLINQSHPVIKTNAWTARMVLADGRLFMTIGEAKTNMPTAILENKNLEDPSNPAEWVAAEGDGHIDVDFSTAPTAKHEDYRLHVFDDGEAFECKGVPRKYWLFVIANNIPNVAGRACGRAGFAAPNVTGPYTFCNWVVDPKEGSETPPGSPTSPCLLWPGDVIKGNGGTSLYFAAGWGNIYRMPLNATTKVLQFSRLPSNAVIAEPAPTGAYDDVKQIEYTFLPPAVQGGRWRLYHASYADHTENPDTHHVLYGYKLAIGMYSFDWV